MAVDDKHIIDQLEKMPSELRSGKIRLEFLLSQDMPKKTRKLIEKYIQTLEETHEEFYKRIKKTLT